MAVKVRHEINILDSLLSAASGNSESSQELVLLDTSKYVNPTFYFEVVADTSVSLATTVSLRRFGTSTDDATINVPLLTTSFTRLRSTAFTPPVGQTTYRVFIANTLGATKNVKCARIIVIDNPATLTSSQTQIEVGNNETGKTNTTVAALTNPKYWNYNSSKWNGSSAFYLDATFNKNADVISFVNSGAIAFDGTDPGSITPTPPTHQANDILIAVAWNSGGSLPTTATAGWSKIADVDGTGAATWWWKRATAAGTAGPNFTSADTDLFGLVYVIRGCVTTGTPYEGAATTGDGTTTDTTPDTAAITTLGFGRSVYCFLAHGDNTTFASGNPPANWDFIDSVVSGSGTDAGFEVIRRYVPNATAISSAVVGTWSVAEIYGALTLAFIPATQTISLQEDDGAFGSWTDKATISTSGYASGLSRARSSAFTPTSGRNYRLASVTESANAGYSMYNAKVVVDQKTIAVENKTTGVINSGGTTLTINVTVASGSNQALALAASYRASTIPTTKLTSVTVNGSSATFVRRDANTDRNSEIWYFKNPSAGTYDVVFTWDNDCESAVGSVVQLSGVDQTTVVGNNAGNTGTGTSESVTVTSTSNNLIIANLATYPNGGSNPVTTISTGGEFEQWNTHSADDRIGGAGASKFVDGSSTTISWTSSQSFTWAASAVEFLNNGSSQITKLEEQYLLLNTADDNTTNPQTVQTLYDSGEWVVDTGSITYKHAMDANNAAASADLVDIDNANTQVTNSSVTGANQQISSALTMPTTGHQIDTDVDNTSGTIAASRILSTVVLSSGGGGGSSPQGLTTLGVGS